MQSAVFFPAKANFDWRGVGLEALGSEVRVASVLYEVVGFELGAYLCTVTPNGSWDIMIPPGTDAYDRWEPIPDRFLRGSCSAVIEDPRTKEKRVVVDGKPESIFQVSFEHYLGELGLIGPESSWYDFKTFTWNEQGKRIIGKMLSADLRSDLYEDLGGSYFLRKAVLKSLNEALILSQGFDTPVVVDPIHRSVLRRKLGAVETNLQSVGRIALPMLLPDLRSYSFPEISDLREDAGICELRRELCEVSRSVRDSETPDSDVAKKVIRDIVAQLAVLAPSKTQVMAEFILGVIPGIGTGAGLASLLAGLAKVEDFSTSWLALVIRRSETS